MATSIDSFNDLRELGIDCEDSDSLTETFNKAANHLQNLLPNLDSQTLLTLYGYYKQGSQGPCNTPKPSWFDMKAKSKWEAWNKLGLMSQKEAKITYINIIKKLDPKFDSSKESWVSVSTFQKDQNIDDCNQKTIIDFVKEDACSQVMKILEDCNYRTDLVNKVDEDGLGLIHWAADRGSVETLKILISYGADVNLQDADGQTALHYASSCGHSECVKLLLENKARKDIFDNDKLSPVDVSDASVKELLVNFV